MIGSSSACPYLRSGAWNYPEVTDSFTLRHRNLLHCSLLVISRARVV